ncbi:MAG: carboxypeptidase regulatory-like domain-containing protein [Terracidiphilus sp.]
MSKLGARRNLARFFHPGMRITAFAALSFLFPIATIHAQVTATIAGTVTDQTGAVVPEADVTLVNEATQFTRAVKTNANGEYVASAVPTGSYSITVAKAGFEQLQRTGVQLPVATTVTVDLQLSVGAATQTVAVTGAPPLLQTQTSTVSGLVDPRQMLAIPLASRDFTDLVLLTPGAHLGTASNLAAGGSGYSMRGGDNYSVNGSVAAGNSYMVDGIFDRMLWLNTLVVVPVVDSIQEYRVMTSNYSAEYGNAAGTVTEVATKAGSNGFHGDAWEFVRNTDFNANNFFNNLNKIPRPAFHRNQFGLTAGGPIRKNRTFVFGDYEGTRAAQPITSTSTIPTPAEDTMIETGNFGAFPSTIYDPYSTTTVGTTTQRTAFTNNQITPNLLDKAAGMIAQLMPTPTSTAAANNYTYNHAETQDTNQFDIRIDQNLRASDNLFVHYDYDKSDFVVPGAIPSPANSPVPIGPYLSTNANGTSEPLFNQCATIGYTKVLGSTMVSESHLGLVRWHAQITPLGIGFNTATALGMPGVNFNQQSGGMPAFTISGLSEIGDNSTYPEDSAQTTIQADSALTLIHGAHTIKVGLVALRHYFNGFSGFPDRGTFDFNGEFTSQLNISSTATALADFAMGAMDSASRAYLDGPFALRAWQLSPYAQDDWRVTKRLTVNAGLRWDLVAPYVEKHNHWANLNIATGQLLLAGQNGNSRSLVNFDKSAVGPRLGLAYSLSPKTVIRAGAGISYVFEDAIGAELYKNLPYYSSQIIATSTNSVPAQFLSQGLPVPSAPIGETAAQLSTGSPEAWNQKLNPDLVASWSLGVERQLTHNIMLDVTYVGTRGDRLLINSVNMNEAQPGAGAVAPRRPYYAINPNLVNISYVTDWGGSKYQSLQAHVEKRYPSGLTFGASYTYSSYLSDAGNPNGGGNSNYQNDQCVACNWGPTPDDYKHVFSLNHVYELPFGPQQRFLNHGIFSYVLGGWSVNGIWSAYSGSRFTVLLSANVSNASGGGNQRPNRTGNGTLPSNQRSYHDWFNLNEFVAPAQYTFGNSGTGILEGPSYSDADLGVFRSVKITERYKLTFRGESFNTFNNVNFSAPNATIGTATAGTISSTVVGPGGSSARVLQLAAKVEF